MVTRIDGTEQDDTLDYSSHRFNLRGETYKLYGLGGDDRLVGGVRNDQLYGGAGDDTLIGGRGADLLVGGAGQDEVDYRGSSTGVNVSLKTGRGAWGDAEGDILEGIEHAIGTKHADSLTGGDGNNRLTGLQGNDYLNGGKGNDALYGGEGDDYLIGGAGADRLEGGTGSDTASYASETTYAFIDLKHGTVGGSAVGDRLVSIENLEGTGTSDTLFGANGANHLMGFSGDDILGGRGGADILDGGAGYDFAFYEDAASAVRVDLTLGIGSWGEAEGDRLIAIEAVLGSAHDDTLIGDYRDNGLYGRGGRDTLYGREGNDFLSGEAGRDNLFGGAGNDRLFGGEGDDFFADVDGIDLFDGGAGRDFVAYDEAGQAVLVDLQAGTGAYGAQGDTFVSIEGVQGSGYGDVLKGTQGANTLVGGAGNDHLEGRGGADTLHGGTGEDFASYSSSATGVKVSLATGKGSKGDAEGDTLNGIENLIGSAHDDYLTGDGNDNILRGLDGDDLLVGGAGYGPGSEDLLIGGHGRDTMYGGTGDDTFLFESLLDSGKTASTADVISDFRHGDIIDLHLIDARPDLAGNQGFTFIGSDTFTGAGQMRSYTDGTDTFVQLNTSANNGPEMVIRLEGVVNLTVQDFLV